MHTSSTHIGRYEILSKIGEGAISEVYAANDPKTGRKIALKILKDNASLTEFVQESRSVGKLSHHNIVSIYDVGEYQGYAYIAMELLEGESLDELMHRSKQLRWPVVVGIAKQLASALDYAHSQGIMHGDLRPGNIIFDLQNNKAILTDFGNARQSDIYQTHTLKVNEVDASTPYLSPERLQGLEADARSDLFSLGCVLYQLLTGEKPFEADDFEQLTTQITQRAHKAISVSVNQVPDQLIHVIDRLLYKNPEDRIQSASELLRELELLPEESYVPSAHSGRKVFVASAGIVAAISFAAAAYMIFSPPPERQKPAQHTEFEKAPVNPETRITPVETVQKQTSLEARINKSIAKFECSSLFAEMSSANEVRIRGHVSMEEDVIALMDLMDGFPGVTNVTYEVSALKWPFCEAVSILSVDKHRNISKRSGLQLQGKGIKHGVNNDNNVAFEITTPDFNAYMYIDYYGSDGKVSHLYPENNTISKQEAKSTFVVNTNVNVNSAEQGLVVVIAAYNPLSGARPRSEPAQQYLSELHKQVVVNKAELAADYLLLENIADKI